MAMDLTIRDWMVVVGVLLIVAVGLDAWRRVRSDKYSRVKVKLVDPDQVEEPVEDGALLWPNELPNGPARVVQRSDLLRAARGERSESRLEPDASRDGDALDSVGDDVELVTGMSTREELGDARNLDWLDGIGTDDEVPAAPAATPDRLPREIDPEVFMLNVVARSRDGFRGEDILHILLACDLRFGDMNFFHRHEFEAGKGAIQFSVANMMQPGIFDIDNMSDFNTPGLVFFLTLPGPEDMMKAFDYMLETAQAVSRNLEGDVLDETRSVLTKQTLDHCRQQIRDLERRMLAKAR
jgi:cell division protein ZipA